MDLINLNEVIFGSDFAAEKTNLWSFISHISNNCKNIIDLKKI